jgi:hypothetical protein
MGPVEGTSRVASSVRKKRPARVLFAAVLLIVFYFLFFPYPLGREIVARPRWAVAVPPATSSPPSETRRPSWQFQLGSRFGYVQGDGSVQYAGTALYGVALSETSFVNYTRLGTDWILQDTSGKRLSSFSGSGYPLVGPQGRRLFNVKSDLSGIIELDKAGAVLWERDFPALMTTLSVQGDLLVVGLLNGSLLLMNTQGFPLFEYSPGGSRIPVILGTAAAPDGSLIAAVCGIGPQHLTVLSRQSAGYAPLATLGLSSDYRREVRMGFSPDSRYLYFEGRSGAGLFEPAGQSLRWVSLRGRLAGAAFPGHGRLVALASRDGGRAQIAIEPPSGGAVYREEFPARELYLGNIDGQLLLGWDGQLLRIDIEAR